MHPLLSDFRKLLCFLVVWLLTGMLMAGLLAGSGVAPWRNAILFAIPLCLAFGFFSLTAYYVCRSRPFARRRPLSTVVIFGSVSLTAGIVFFAVGVGVNFLEKMFDAEWAGIALTPYLATILFTAGSGFYVASILLHDVFIAFENMWEAQRREAESMVLARDAELQVLRSQIDPHFLFNSLNSISALTTIDPDAARAMTIALGDFFRQTLVLSEHRTIALADEIALCKNFLAIEKIRFGNRIAVDIQIDAQAQNASVPPLSLQPLVENAVKHGIRNLDDGGTIVIKATVYDQRLHISIENPIDEKQSRISGSGIGLKNTRLRLAALYDGTARIDWQQTSDCRFIVTLTIPFEQST